MLWRFLFLCKRKITEIFNLIFISDPPSNAKWILNVLWEMEGIDVHLDTNIGKKLSGLAHTLTALAGDPNDDEAVDILNEADTPDRMTNKMSWNQVHYKTVVPNIICIKIVSGIINLIVKY